MGKASDLISPRRFAQAIGVSESSLKRWCDQGLIETVRTAGGHRRLSLRSAVKFAQEQNREIKSPEALGLAPAMPRKVEPGEALERLTAALVAGDETAARQIVMNQWLSGRGLSAVFDAVVAPAFHRVGDAWERHGLQVFEERRATEMMLRVLVDLRRLQDVAPSPFVAIGATMEGDPYALPCAMADLVLREAGYDATSLGASIPAASLARAVNRLQPHLFWWSVSHFRSVDEVVAQGETLASACRDAGTALVVGGRAIDDALRRRMTFAAFGDTMQHLESFARSLRRSLARPAKGKRKPRG